MSENSEASQTAAFNARRDLYIAAGFAPGRYFCRCAHCHETFRGDKRAVTCFPCATALINANFVEPAKADVALVDRPEVEQVCDRLRLGGPNALEIADTAADLIERLSRDRDTVIEECIAEAQAEADAATSLLEQNVFVSQEAKNMLAGQRTVAESIVKSLRALHGKPSANVD